MDINADHISKEAKSPDGSCWADLRDRLPDHTPCTRGTGGQQLSHASAPGPRDALSTARRDGQEPGQAYLLTPGFSFTCALSLTAPGSRVGAPRQAGEAPCRAVPGHPVQGPQMQRELSERGTMLVSHRLTCGPRRVSSLRRHLSTQRASSRPTPRARASAPGGFRYSRAAR